MPAATSPANIFDIIPTTARAVITTPTITPTISATGTGIQVSFSGVLERLLN
jgi:hypothetical protein